MTTWTVFTAALIPFVAPDDASFIISQTRDDDDRRPIDGNDIIAACFGEAGDKGKEAFAAAGVVIDETKGTISFTVEGLKAAALIPYRVMADYDRDDNLTTGIWEELGLSGDDSVDYFGGYLTPLIDTLYAYAQSQGIAVLRVTEADYTALLTNQQ